MAKTPGAVCNLGAEFWRRNMSEASPRNGFFLYRHSAWLVPAGRGRCHRRTFGKRPLRWMAPPPKCQHRAMHSVERKPYGRLCPLRGQHTRSAQCREQPTWVTMTPLCRSFSRLLQGCLRRNRSLYMWPTGEGFPCGIGLNSMWFLLPFWLYSGWDSFLSGGSQLPRFCDLFLCFCGEVFFFHLQDFFLFCHQKKTLELRVPSWLWLTSVDS